MKAIQLIEITLEEFSELISNIVDAKLKDFQKDQNTQTANDDLMSREQVAEFLQINPVTLWRWTNMGKITVYKFANKCYYKRSELMETITPLKV
jgi:HD-GYP domain-containing protein (c-di-GMP phosphodiesterase class II)